MNFFPSLNRSRKVHSFSNPLNGLIYRHQTIAPLSSPKTQLTTISYLSQQHKSTSRPPPLKTNSHIRFQKGQIPESNNRNSQSVHRSSHIMKQYDTLQSEVVKHEDRGRTEMRSPRTIGYNFPEVEVLPLPLIHKFEDIVATKLRISLEKYFKLYFHAGLRFNSKTLNEKVEKYLPLLQKSGLLDQAIDKKMWPKEFWEIKNTQQLLFWIEKYQKNGSDYWVRYILILMQLYCVPHPDIRKTSLENVLLTLSKQISIMTDQPIHRNYVLLLENGTPVVDILDIPFSTTKLYLAMKMSQQKQVDSYTEFLVMVKLYHEECRKKGFIGRLRKHFRREIVADKYDEESINYEVDFVQRDKVRKVTFQRAMDLLEKKGSSRKNITKHFSPLPSARPKSRESIWKQQNVEENQTVRSKIPLFYFHIELANKRLEKEIQTEFQHYHSLSQQIDSSIGHQEIFIYIIEEHHPIIKELIKNRFHSLRVRTILQLVTEDKLSDDRKASRQKMTWREFIEFAVLCQPTLQKMIHLPDCHQIVRNFVENYLNMKEEDYFREELTAKLFSTYEGDSESLSIMEEVIWSWLAQNDFLRHGAIQRELLWKWESRSRLFYLLMVAMIMGTFKTTPMDLAYEMLV